MRSLVKQKLGFGRNGSLFEFSFTYEVVDILFFCPLHSFFFELVLYRHSEMQILASEILGIGERGTVVGYPHPLDRAFNLNRLASGRI